MGNAHKKKNTGIVTIEKGTVEDNKGKKYVVDFVGDNDDFVNISYFQEKKKDESSIKALLKQNKDEIYDICFINNYSHLLVACNKGNLYVYKRKINGKSNLIFEELILFKPHNDTIIQILKLQSGHILTLSSDSSAKILKIEIDINGILYENQKRCDEIQTLLESRESYNYNSAIELISGNLIISQAYFINFFSKKNYDNINDNIEFQLTKKIFTNSDNIFFAEIDNKTIVATQISNNSLDFYRINDYSVIKKVENIEFYNDQNSMCLISKDTLALSGNNGSIYLINTIMKQLFSLIHLDNCQKITCIKSIDIEHIIIGCSNSDNYDVVIYKKIGNNFEEIKRKEKVHNEIIKDIKLITLSISKNKNHFCKNYNVITIGSDHKVKLILNTLMKIN